ncbi:MAG: hypothetical protein WBM80_04955 [Woeseiaceae bacterium]
MLKHTMVILILAGTSVAADTEIHRCLLADGTTAFQETPCAAPAVHVDNGSEADESHSQSDTPAAEDNASDFVNPVDEPASPSTPAEATLPEAVSQGRAECEKTTRDAIDAIDLEMRGNAYTKEQGEEYLAELLALTQRLRACKQL